MERREGNAGNSEEEPKHETEAPYRYDRRLNELGDLSLRQIDRLEKDNPELHRIMREADAKLRFRIKKERLSDGEQAQRD